MNISKQQYIILKKLHNSKEKLMMDTEASDYKFLLQSNLIKSEYNTDGAFVILIPNGMTSITKDGISVYNAYTLNRRRHWQSMFIPQALNILVSMITTVITYFILEFLKLR